MPWKLKIFLALWTLSFLLRLKGSSFAQNVEDFVGKVWIEALLIALIYLLLHLFDFHFCLHRLNLCLTLLQLFLSGKPADERARSQCAVGLLALKPVPLK